MINKQNNRFKKTLLIVTVFLFIFSYQVFPQTMPLAEKQMDPAKKEKLLTQDLKELKKAKLLKVEERTKFLHYISDGSFPSQNILAEKIYFDKNGNRIEHINLQRDSLLENRQTFQYDSLGHLILTETYNALDIITLRRQSFYDEKGREVLIKYNEQKLRGENKAEIKYNEKNTLDELITYNPNGNILNILKMTYDDDRLISSETQDVQGRVIEKSVLNYDNDGNIISETLTINKDTSTIYYEYNSNGNLIKIKYHDATRYMDYNENGDLVEDRQIYYTGETEYKFKFIYYDNGLLKEIKSYSPNDRQTFSSVYEYEFYK